MNITREINMNYLAKGLIFNNKTQLFLKSIVKYLTILVHKKLNSGYIKISRQKG